MKLTDYDSFPDRLPILVEESIFLYPFMIAPIFINDEQNIKLTDGTVDWTIVRVKALEPGDTVLFYKLHATRRDDV